MNRRGVSYDVGRDIDRLTRATEDALADGLEVWRYDLDMSSFALVKTHADGRHGTTYPNMHWEPKKAFWAVADYYARSQQDGDRPTCPAAN